MIHTNHSIQTAFVVFCSMYFCMVQQVWRVDGEGKTVLSDSNSEDSKLFSGDCYIFQYSCPGERGEEHIIGTWFGRQSIQVVMLAVTFKLFCFVI